MIAVDRPQRRLPSLRFLPDLYRVLRIKAAEIDRTVSDLVNESVRVRLAEDAEDLAAFDERANEPSLRFEDALNDLKRRGKI
ncbi:MAG: hypothetical protein OXC31_04820 [Spirochaetaceae bacterium]|nr:hypothetical protein [Spirochaetaceae bacterium]